MPLLKSYAAVTEGKPLAAGASRADLVFEDFENGYKNWRVEGAAFGPGPAAGTLPGQQPVSGFEGKGLVNSFRDGDDTTGRLVSKEFTVERSFIRFLVGGGSRATTQVRLVVDGKTVRAASGRDLERLQPAFWDVSAFRGKSAHLEIVDEQKGPWGHINVDQIAFCDRVGDHATLALLEELLPARFRDIIARQSTRLGDRNVLELVGREDRDGTATVEVGPLRVIRRRLGKGHVVLVLGPILDPAHAELNGGAPSRVRRPLQPGGRHVQGARGRLAEGARIRQPGSCHHRSRGHHPAGLRRLERGVADVLGDRSILARGSGQAGRSDGRGADDERCPGGVRDRCAGATAEVPFLLSWHYPNKYNEAGTWMGCHYTTLWSDAAAVVRETAAQLAAIREKTERFRATFYDSTLPYWLLDCLTSQAAIIRHIGVVFRIANGDIFGWEGSNGCCQPTCTHVWGYEQTLSRLFPGLEQEMRRIDFHHQQRPDGGINNRTDVPSPPRPTGEQPFTDGHASCILKAYREALNHPDDSWLRAYWPQVSGPSST